MADAELTGDWGGRRSRLADTGFDVEFEYFADVMVNTSGGVERGADFLGALDVIFRLDFDRMFGWRGGRLVVDVAALHGTRPSRRVGDVQWTDNIEAHPTVTLYRALLEQYFGSRVSLAAGIYAVDWEFDITPGTELFVHSSFATGGDLGNSGRIGPSIYPIAGLGARVAVIPLEGFVLHAAIVDGVPQDPDARGGVQVSLSSDDGAFVIGEAAIELERGKFAVGAWHFTTRFDDRRGTSGIYALALQPIGEQWSVFARAGAAEPTGNHVDVYLGGGLIGRSVAFEEDRVGLGVASARPVGRARWETAFEATWRVNLLDGLALQPDFQIVLNPGVAPVGTPAAVVAGARLIVLL